MRKREEKYIVKNGNDGLDVDVDDDNADDDPGNGKEVTEKAHPVETISTYDEERERLLAMHKVESQKFDRMTNEMKLIADSHIFNDRMAACAAVLDNHRAAIKKVC
jgi:hypothetical protein